MFSYVVSFWVVTAFNVVSYIGLNLGLVGLDVMFERCFCVLVVCLLWVVRWGVLLDLNDCFVGYGVLGCLTAVGFWGFRG